MTYRRKEVKRQYVKLWKRSQELSITQLILILLFISLKIVIKKKWWREREMKVFFFAEIKFIKTNKTELHSTTRRDPLKSNNIRNRNWESLSN